MPGNPLDQGHPQFPLSPDFFNDFMVHRCNFFRKKCQKLGQLGWHTPDLLESFGLFSPVSNIVGNVVPPFKKKKEKELLVVTRNQRCFLGKSFMGRCCSYEQTSLYDADFQFASHVWFLKGIIDYRSPRLTMKQHVFQWNVHPQFMIAMTIVINHGSNHSNRPVYLHFKPWNSSNSSFPYYNYVP